MIYCLAVELRRSGECRQIQIEIIQCLHSTHFIKILLLFIYLFACLRDFRATKFKEMDGEKNK